MFVHFEAAPLLGPPFLVTIYPQVQLLRTHCRFTIAVFNISLTNLSQNFSFPEAAICVNTIDNNFPDKSNVI